MHFSRMMVVWLFTISKRRLYGIGGSGFLTYHFEAFGRMHLSVNSHKLNTKQIN